MMFKEWIFLATYKVFSGGQIGDLLNDWEAAGVFSYMLPFLLIFALIFGLLSKLNFFGSPQDPSKGKTVNAIIAIAVSLMALQFDVVSVFFANIFPRMGIGLSIILVILILGGLFIPTNKENNWFLVAISVIIFIMIASIVINSLDSTGVNIGIPPWIEQIWNQYGSIIIFVIIIIVVVAVTTSQGKKKSPYTMENQLSKSLNS